MFSENLKSKLQVVILTGNKIDDNKIILIKYTYVKRKNNLEFNG